MTGCLRYFGIILMLIGCGVATYGTWVTIGATGESIESVNESANSGAAFLGVTIGATITTAIFGCVSFATFVVGAIIFWIARSNRNRERDRIEMERRHQEQLAAITNETQKQEIQP